MKLSSLYHKLGELFHSLKRWKSQAEDHPFAISGNETIVFFDTETTGLKGTGTHIFLLVLLEADDEGFMLTQYVLADLSNEAALLFESKLWQRNVTIVSYNGKSFDWPQLQVRWTLNQQFLPQLKSQWQIDLLHSTKRLWKDDLSRMKLTQVEQSATTYTNIGKWNGDLKKRQTSTEILQAVTAHFETKDTGYAHFYLAFELKRIGETDLAIQSFQTALPTFPARKQLQAYEQLAGFLNTK